MAKQIFEEVKVVEFAWAGVGPWHGLYLAYHGATVVHVESSRRPDVIRAMPPYKDGKPGVNRSLLFASAETNKYGITLNLKHPRAVEVAKRLVAWSDVVIENFTPGVMKRWGINYECLKEVKADIIMLSSCNQGQTGPDAQRPGYGSDLASLAGFNYLTGWPDRSPSAIYGAYTDYIAPPFGVATLVAALDYHRRTGKGLYIDLSQFESSLQFLSPVVLDYVVNQRIAMKAGNYCRCAAPHGAYRCRGEDKWCTIAIFTDEEWKNCCQVMGNPTWTEDPKFSTHLGRIKAYEELDKLIEQWTAQHTPEKVMRLMQEAGVMAGMVATGEDIHKDPQLRHRQFFKELEHPEMGMTAFENPHAGCLSKAPGRLLMPPFCLGEHNEYVYKQILGMSDAEYDELEMEGVYE